MLLRRVWHQLASLVVLTVTVVTWAWLDRAVVERHPYVAATTVLFFFAELNTRQLMARISRSRAPQASLLQPAAWLLLANVTLRHGGVPALTCDSWTLLAVLGAVAALVYAVYVVAVVRQLTSFLGIHAFRLRSHA